jgi:hypothetical protein
MAGRKKKVSRRAIAQNTQLKKTSEDLSPEATESQSLQVGARPSTAMQRGELNSEDKSMEKAEKGIFENTSELARNLFSLDGAKTLAALYIETTEKLAEGVLAFQATTTEWARDTPLATVFEANNSMARKLVEFSAGTARRLWRIEEKHAA